MTVDDFSSVMEQLGVYLSGQETEHLKRLFDRWVLFVVVDVDVAFVVDDKKTTNKRCHIMQAQRSNSQKQ